jgi:hypothetical protein
VTDPTSSGGGYATPPLAVQASLGTLVDGYSLGGWYAGELRPVDVAAALRAAGIPPDEFHAAVQFTDESPAAGGPAASPFLVWRDADGSVRACRAADGLPPDARPVPGGAHPDAALRDQAARVTRRRGAAGHHADPAAAAADPAIRPDGLPADAVPITPPGPDTVQPEPEAAAEPAPPTPAPPPPGPPPA